MKILTQDQDQVFSPMLEAAIVLTGADCGNLQLLGPADKKLSVFYNSCGKLPSECERECKIKVQTHVLVGIEGRLIGVIDTHFKKNNKPDKRRLKLASPVFKLIGIGLSHFGNLQKSHSVIIEGLSHQLKTPLTCILAWAQLMQKDASRLNEGLKVIESSAKAQRQTLDNLLIEAGDV